MSIIQLKHNEIDPNAWDNLVQNTKGSRIFSEYAYLNAVNPEFEALIEEKQGRYINAFPICLKRKFGLNYIVQPVFTQQLQLLSQDEDPGDEFLSKLDEYLGTFPSIRLSLDSKSAHLLSTKSKYRSLSRVTYTIELKGIDGLSKAYSKNHKRNIKGANKTDWTLNIDNDFEALISGFKNYKGKEIKLSENFIDSFQRLIPFFKSNDKIQVFSALDENGDKMASSLFAGHKEIMTFLLSYSNEKAKKAGIMHALINEWLHQHSSGYKVLDFEGGNIAPLARFYSGFGANQEGFTYLEKHSFPLGYFFK